MNPRGHSWLNAITHSRQLLMSGSSGTKVPLYSPFKLQWISFKLTAIMGRVLFWIDCQSCQTNHNYNNIIFFLLNIFYCLFITARLSLYICYVWKKVLVRILYVNTYMDILSDYSDISSINYAAYDLGRIKWNKLYVWFNSIPAYCITIIHKALVKSST